MRQYLYIKGALITVTTLAALLVFTLAGCITEGEVADAWGAFEARETIISAEATGRLLYFKAERGEVIEEGVIMGVIDTVQHVLNYHILVGRQKAVEARIGDAESQLATLYVRRKNLEREADRTRRLLRDQAATQQQLDEIEGNIKVIDSDIEAVSRSKETIRAEVAAMDAQIALALEQISNCTIVNPLTGTVLERYAESHELVTPGKPLYKIADLSVMDLRVYVSGSQLAQISLGQPVTVYVDEDAHSRRMLEGTVSWISSRAEFTPKTILTREERVTRVYAVKILVVNDGTIKIGMPGEAIFGQ